MAHGAFTLFFLGVGVGWYLRYRTTKRNGFQIHDRTLAADRQFLRELANALYDHHQRRRSR